MDANDEISGGSRNERMVSCTSSGNSENEIGISSSSFSVVGSDIIMCKCCCWFSLCCVALRCVGFDEIAATERGRSF